MKTEILKINPKISHKSIIQYAATIIKNGGVVVFPTETVYGLGANALDKKAVRKIFKIKGRPTDNPLIVHIARFGDLDILAKHIPKEAKILAQKFWPGPLTFILFKNKIVPDEVSAGSNTVAVRMPNNQIARELIRASGVPIAAPSANVSGRPSPTNASTVFDDLNGKIPLIIDDGPTVIGLESTVLDLTEEIPTILRPGAVTKEMLEKVLKMRVNEMDQSPKKHRLLKSPGLKYRHYAPLAPLVLISGETSETIQKIKKLIVAYKKQKLRVGVLATSKIARIFPSETVVSLGSQKNLKKIARNLFSALRRFDALKVDVILAESLPEVGLGRAIQDRLKKAASRVY